MKSFKKSNLSFHEILIFLFPFPQTDLKIVYITCCFNEVTFLNIEYVQHSLTSAILREPLL